MKNKVLNLDKSSWVLTKLGDLAKDISKRVDNPGESEYDRFVGLGNFVSGDIKIKSWETTKNLASSAKAFQIGDILFARRNAYLRRASLVDFDGCCSGDAFVLRENHDEVVPGFLAFLMNSNTLWDFANSNAAGTMSKRVKWRDLAEYEFLLPPKQEQAKLAELLWAMDEVIEYELKILQKYFITKQCKIKDLYFNSNTDFKLVSLGEISTLITKGTTPTSLGESFVDSGINFIKIESLTPEGGVIKDKLEHIDNKTHEKLKRSQIQAKDILFSIAGALGRCTVVSKSICPANTNQALAIIRLKTNIVPEFILEYLKSDLIKNHIERVHVKSAQSNLSLKNVNEFQVPLPSNNIQNQISDEVKKLNLVLSDLKNKILSSKDLQKSLIGQIF